MKWARFATVVALGALLDQLSKQWADSFVRPRLIVPVVKGYFELRYSRNPGAFFSLGAELPAQVRRGFFIAASLAALALITVLYHRTRPQQRRLAWALSLLASGALGNLIDRIRRGEVVDFLHLHVHEVFHWATFNVADILLAAGLTLLALDLLGPESRKPSGDRGREPPRSTDSVPTPGPKADNPRSTLTEPISSIQASPS